MPLYSIDKIDEKGFLALWDITETEEEFIGSQSIPDEELGLILESTSPRRRLEKLAVRALINTCFERKHYLGYEENNRPFIKNYSGDISISHAGNFVCIIVHEEKYVGIDIETRGRDFTAVENKILTPHEMKHVTNKDRADQLCLIWSAKEAIYKVMHQQRVDFNRQMEIKKFKPQMEGQLQASFFSDNKINQKLSVNYRILDGYVITWVLR